MMTDITVARETRLFFCSLVLGAGLSVGYDFLLVLRLQTKHRSAAVSLEDFLYFLFCAAVTFGFVLKSNRGSVRGYLLVGQLLGWLCWHLTLGEWMVRLADAVVSLVRRLIAWCIRVVLFPLRLLLQPVWRVFGRFWRRFRRDSKKVLEKVVEKGKYGLKRKRMMLYNLSSRFQTARPKEEETDGKTAQRTRSSHPKEKKETA